MSEISNPNESRAPECLPDSMTYGQRLTTRCRSLWCDGRDSARIPITDVRDFGERIAALVVRAQFLVHPDFSSDRISEDSIAIISTLASVSDRTSNETICRLSGGMMQTYLNFRRASTTGSYDLQHARPATEEDLYNAWILDEVMATRMADSFRHLHEMPNRGGGACPLLTEAELDYSSHPTAMRCLVGLIIEEARDNRSAALPLGWGGYGLFSGHIRTLLDAQRRPSSVSSSEYDSYYPDGLKTWSLPTR